MAIPSKLIKLACTIILGTFTFLPLIAKTLDTTERSIDLTPFASSRAYMWPLVGAGAKTETSGLSKIVMVAKDGIAHFYDPNNGREDLSSQVKLDEAVFSSLAAVGNGPYKGAVAGVTASGTFYLLRAGSIDFQLGGLTKAAYTKVKQLSDTLFVAANDFNQLIVVDVASNTADVIPLGEDIYEVSGEPVVSGNNVLMASTDGFVRKYNVLKKTLKVSSKLGKRLAAGIVRFSNGVFVVAIEQSNGTSELARLSESLEEVNSRIRIAGYISALSANGNHLILAVGQEVMILDLNPPWKLKKYSPRTIVKKALVSKTIDGKVLFIGAEEEGSIFLIDENAIERGFLSISDPIVGPPFLLSPNLIGVATNSRILRTIKILPKH